ncbi:alpha/beta fold hydrolase [Catellatospora sp. NPDC049609]|uniref:thioesterase II family protein n=1 Tax=Catellatospora sp. NPDC049609 TaxID=3155505 RepID=UPI00343B5ADA
MSLRDLRAGRAAPELTLVLLHHAGGSAASFAPFARLLPASWRLLAAELPGRFYEPPTRRCRNVGEAVAHLSAALRRELAGPYALFGHSLGALLAFEVARELERDGPGPAWLGVSGCPAPPAFAATWASARGGDISPQRLPRWVRGVGGGGRFDERMLATLRDDLAIAADYTFTAGAALRASLSVFQGDADPLTSARNVAAWAAQAGAGAAFHTLPGGHFFLFDHPAQMCERIVYGCRGALPVYSLSGSAER